MKSFLLILGLVLGAAPASAKDQKAKAPAGEAEAVAQKGSTQICGPGKVCNERCPGGDCKVECAKGATCNATCAGGGCTHICRAAATCNFTCAGGKCTRICEKGATCNLTCSGGGCTDK